MNRIQVQTLLLWWVISIIFPPFTAQAEPTQRFVDTEIVVGVHMSTIGNPAKAHAQTWKKRSGGNVRIQEFQFIELFSNLLTSLTAEDPLYDVILFPSAWAGDFFPYLAEVPPALTDDETFDDILSIYRERLMQWDNKQIAITIDGDLFNGYYRQDLFKNEQNRADFKKQYGYALKAPDTWTEYADIAAFFTGRSMPGTDSVFGTAEAFARGGQQFWNMFSRAAAYTNHPKNPGAQFFDPVTMEAQINNPGWVHAVEEYLEILSFCPPDALTFDMGKVREAFAGGHTAMALDWGDTGQIVANREGSAIQDNVGYFVLPGTRKVWNMRTHQWDQVGRVYKVPFLAFGGWVAGVPKNSRQQEAAWDFIMWYGSPENSLRDVVSSGTGINPYRYSHFSNIDAWTDSFSKRAAAEYLAVLQSSLESPNAALDLRIPGFHEYTEALEQELSRILHKDVSVQDGLDRVSKQWEQITDRLGREKQRDIYRSSMGLPLYRRPGI